MPPLRTTRFACLLAALLVIAPFAASATGAGGTLKQSSATVRSSDQPIGALVPEPGAALVFGTGLLVVGVALRRRIRR